MIFMVLAMDLQRRGHWIDCATHATLDSFCVFHWPKGLSTRRRFRGLDVSKLHFVTYRPVF